MLGAGRVFSDYHLTATLPGIIVGTVLAFARSLLANLALNFHYLLFPVISAKPAPYPPCIPADSDARRGERGGEAVRDFDCISADFAVDFEWLARISRERALTMLELNFSQTLERTV